MTEEGSSTRWRRIRNDKIADREDFADSADILGCAVNHQLLQKIITVGLNYAVLDKPGSAA